MLFFVAYISDAFQLSAPMPWLEGYLDFASVQATLVTGYRTTSLQRSSTYIEYNHRVRG